MTPDDYVVTRPFCESNVGSNLASMAGALWLARKLRRPLVVDWRWQMQLRDKSLNYFTEFFDPPAEIDGVPVMYAPAPEVGDYDRSSSQARWLEPGRRALSGRGALPARVMSCSRPTTALTGCIPARRRSASGCCARSTATCVRRRRSRRARPMVGGALRRQLRRRRQRTDRQRPVLRESDEVRGPRRYLDLRGPPTLPPPARTRMQGAGPGGSRSRSGVASSSSSQPTRRG